MASGQDQPRISDTSEASSANSTTAMLPDASKIPDRKDASVIIEDAASIEDELALQTGWHSQRHTLSLPEAHASIKMPAQPKPAAWRMLLAFAGCGTIISVGYM